MRTITISCLILLSQFAYAQNQFNPDQDLRKGRLYFYWGWNWDQFSKSDINFTGTDYDFTLSNVVANDRQSPFAFNIYLNPANMTIPQYNFRVGYFIKNNWDISFGIDHMKYVMQNDQTVGISGHITNTGTEYDGDYSGEDIVLTKDFLQFEHTDGLNYGNLEVRRSDQIFDFNKTKINFTGGLGFGLLIPRTNTTLLNKERYDEFHFSGYGLHAVAGINVAFFNKFFVQSEIKGGFIDMPDIRTTNSTSDKGSQNFFFSQINVVIGGIINLNKKTKAPSD